MVGFVKRSYQHTRILTSQLTDVASARSVTASRRFDWLFSSCRARLIGFGAELVEVEQGGWYASMYRSCLRSSTNHT